MLNKTVRDIGVIHKELPRRLFLEMVPSFLDDRFSTRVLVLPGLFANDLDPIETPGVIQVTKEKHLSRGLTLFSFIDLFFVKTKLIVCNMTL